MQVLGILGKILSGPWMTKFYTAATKSDLNQDIDINEIKTVFPDIPDDISSGIADILTGKVVGRTICHTWHDNDTRDQSVWSGKIEKLKRRKGDIYCYTVAYWAEDECYENSTDYDIPKHELAADLFYGDLCVS